MAGPGADLRVFSQVPIAAPRLFSVAIVRDATEAEMVLAFLRAEIDSDRFGDRVRSCLTDLGLLHESDLGDEEANRKRREALGCYRGYGRNAHLFEGFPSDVKWKLVSVTVEELGTFRYARVPPWTTKSNEPLLVRDGARDSGIEPEAREKATAVAIEQALKTGDLALEQLEPLIATAESVDGVHILLEGHSRATAYLRSLAQETAIPIIVGYVVSLEGWVWL